MKAMLEFNLPEERPELHDALNGTKWRGLLQGLDQALKFHEGSAREARRLLNDMVCGEGLELFD